MPSPQRPKRYQDRLTEARNSELFGGPPPRGATEWIGGTPSGPGRPTGSGRLPDPVHIVSGDSSFFDALRTSLGFGDNPGASTATDDKFPGMGTVLKGQQAIIEQSRQIVTDMKIASDMIVQFQASQARAMGSWASDMKTMRQEERQHLIGLLDTLNSYVQNTTHATQQMQQMFGSMGMGGSPGWAGTPMMGPQMGPGGPWGFQQPPAPVTPSRSASGGYHGHTGGAYQGRTTMGSLRQRIASSVHREYGQGNPDTPTLNKRFDQTGMHVGYTLVDPNGPNTDVALNSPMVPVWKKIANRQAWASQMAGGYAAGGTMGALRVAPYAGLAIAAGEKVNDAAVWLTEQRAANAPWQQMTGGENFSVGGTASSFASLLGPEHSTDRSGLGQRIQQWGFGLGQRFSAGGMTGEMADEAFQGATSLGYVGERRGDALDFMSEQYKKFGMTVQESMALLEVSARHANASLGGVASGLESVTKAAVATGQNAQLLRQQYISNYTAALQGGAGQSAGTLASAFTMAAGGTNRDLAGLNYASVLENPGMMRLIAGTAGVTPGKLYEQLARGDTTQFTENYQKILNRNLLGTMNQTLRDKFQTLVEQMGGNQEVGKSQNAQREIGLQLMGTEGWNIDAARAALETSSPGSTQDLDDAQVAQAFVTNLVGAGPHAQAEEAKKENQIKPLDEGQQGGWMNSDFLRDRWGKHIEGDGTLDVAGGKAGEFIGGIFGVVSPTMNRRRAVESNLLAYNEYQDKTKSSNPAIEAMLDKFGDKTDARVQVRTKQGTRVVTVDEAIKHHSDQISSGEAVILGVGEESGKRVGDATGTRVGGFKPGQNGVEDSTTKDAPVGVSVEEYKKQNPQQTTSGGASGTIVVEPSHELRKLFNFTGTGSVNIQGAAANNVPPTPGAR